MAPLGEDGTVLRDRLVQSRNMAVPVALSPAERAYLVRALESFRRRDARGPREPNPLRGQESLALSGSSALLRE